MYGFYRWIYPGQNFGADNNVGVGATCCLFFAYAPDNAIGPWGEMPMSSFRPVSIPIPPNAIAVRLFSFAGNWTFNHGDGDTYYGPDGGPPYVPTNSAYMSPAYNSQNLRTITTGSGALVGMFGVSCP